MRATPMQRYALRLLFASRNECPVSYGEWSTLQRDEAEKLMRPFGGQETILREAKLPLRPPLPKKRVSKAKSDSPARADRFKDNAIELGDI